MSELENKIYHFFFLFFSFFKGPDLLKLSLFLSESCQGFLLFSWGRRSLSLGTWWISYRNRTIPSIPQSHFSLLSILELQTRAKLCCSLLPQDFTLLFDYWRLSFVNGSNLYIICITKKKTCTSEKCFSFTELFFLKVVPNEIFLNRFFNDEST